ncbi:TRAP transporter small permease subunit [Rhodobacteraceae bacterium NNCM2]|nr:TRAP transporter small permease subunit [Coraliihabitans acroporae]
MDFLLRTAGAFDRFARGIGKFASWLIIPLILFIIFDVVTRKIDWIKNVSADLTIEYGYSVSFILQDLEWHFHGMLLMLTFGFGYLMNAHVRVDIFREMGTRKTQVWIETLGLLIFAVPFLLVMIKFSYDMTYASYMQGEGSESQVGLGWRWIIKSFLVTGFIVALVAALATLFRCLGYLFGTPEQARHAEDHLQFFTDEEVLPKVKLDEDGVEIDEDATPGGK